jgi:hypothetical protein
MKREGRSLGSKTFPRYMLICMFKSYFVHLKMFNSYFVLTCRVVKRFS